MTCDLPHAIAFDDIDRVGIILDTHGKKTWWATQCVGGSNSTFSTTILENITRNGTGELMHEELRKGPIELIVDITYMYSKVPPRRGKKYVRRSIQALTQLMCTGMEELTCIWDPKLSSLCSGGNTQKRHNIVHPILWCAVSMPSSC